MTFVNLKEIDERVRALHASDWLAYIATTGAVGDLLKHLWRTQGASNTVLGSVLLYDRLQTDEFIRRKPRSYCDLETTMYMAAAAYAKAREIAIDRGQHTRPVVGLAMTAAVRRSTPMKGEHRMHAVARTEDGFLYASVVFEKGRLSREGEGELADIVALDVLLQATRQGALRISQSGMSSGQVHADPHIKAGSCHIEPWWLSRSGFVGSEGFIASDGAFFGLDETKAYSPDKFIVYPGSFNPLHSAHEACAIEVERMTGKRVIFQLTGRHPDKGRVDGPEIARRAKQFLFRWPVLVLDGNGLYIEKARRLPGYGFMLGADAVYGLLNPKYYGGQQGLLDVLREFEFLKTKFYVSGRHVEGMFRTLDDIPIPNRFRHLFHHVAYRKDLSSTQLREG